MEIGFKLLTNGRVQGITYSGVTSLQPITDDWHFAALSYDFNKSISFYLDGEFQGSASVTVHSATMSGFNDPPFRVGIDYQSGNPVGPYNGIVDELRIWNKSLTQEEIRAFMN